MFAFLALTALASLAGNPSDVWPANLKAPRDPAVLAQQLSTLATNAASLPPPLQPAVDFQKVFLQIISAAPESAWLADLKKLAALAGDDVIAATIRERARLWLARAEATQIDVVLRKYYGDKVDFPPSLDAVTKDIPDALRLDPWGKLWSYKLGKANYSKIDLQRYTLAPADYPNLPPLKKSIGDRNPPPRPWKITARSVAGSTALEFKSTASGGTVVAQAGARVDDCVLIFVGQKWALMAALDQLFVVTF